MSLTAFGNDPSPDASPVILAVLEPARLLDPRSAELAAAEPISNSVSIPAAELEDRIFELPPREVAVEIARVEGADLARETLERHGRPCRLVEDFSKGTSKRHRLWEPSEFLADIAPGLAPGVGLDLGCGSGRDAVYLADLGWNVIAVDRLPEALEMGRTLAGRYLPPQSASRIDWRLADADSETWWPPQPFDLIHMRFFLSRPALRSIGERLNPGGSVIVETFTTAHRLRHFKPRRSDLVLEEGELPKLLAGLRVERYTEEWHGDRHTAKGWAVKETP